MANSPSHSLGQIIGDVLEQSLYEPLNQVAMATKLYLDYKHPRNARGGKSLVTWIDARNNKHDLDYVFESGGTEDVFGTPKAFIETAWRRYTKHSKNKAQEIEGAVGHLRTKYREYDPFLGVVLGGEFTVPSINQLKSHGFEVLSFSVADAVAAFALEGVNVYTSESTPDDDIQKEVDKYFALSDAQRENIVKSFRNQQQAAVSAFCQSLTVHLTQAISRIYIVMLHTGGIVDVTSVADAIAAIKSYDESQAVKGKVVYELVIKYTNGSQITASLTTRAEVIDYLTRRI